jgi:N-acetylmuramoyl-L-alanine amidase CwlA
MNILNKKLSLAEFEKYIKGKDFAPNNPCKLVIHHTWKPTEQDWKGATTILALKKFYEGKEWSAGPHLFVAPDGIWLFTDMNTQGIHAGVGNYRSIGIEVVGNYDGAKWSGQIKDLAFGVIKALKAELEILDENICFHRDYNVYKTCPGTAITKKWILEKLKEVAPVAENTTTEPVEPPVFETHPIVTEQGIWQDAIAEILKLIGKFFNSLKI